MGVIVALAAILMGCSGGKPRGVEDARKPIGDARDAAPRPHGPYRVEADAKTGDVQVRVEWKGVPAPPRTSPGRTACGTSRSAAVAPTTTWGIPDVFVAIEVDHGRPLGPRQARLVIEPCTMTPRVMIAGAQLSIASAAEAPVTVDVQQLGALPFGGGALAGGRRTVYLPVAGHEVELPVDAGAIYLVMSPRERGYDPENAFVVVADTPYVAITEATGQVVVRDVPVGTHAVRAWLPDRANQDARLAVGSVTVVAGSLAEVTLDLATP